MIPSSPDISECYSQDWNNGLEIHGFLTWSPRYMQPELNFLIILAIQALSISAQQISLVTSAVLWSVRTLEE